MPSSLDEVMSSLADWSAEYKAACECSPKAGDILKTLDGSPAVLIVESQEGKPPFIYGKAFVPEIPDIAAGWYLQSDEDKTRYGWKCILMARARADLIKKIGLSGETVVVKSLRVIKHSQSGKSLLCEVESY